MDESTEIRDHVDRYFIKLNQQAEEPRLKNRFEVQPRAIARHARATGVVWSFERALGGLAAGRPCCAAAVVQHQPGIYSAVRTV